VLAFDDASLCRLITFTRPLSPKNRVWYLRSLAREFDPDRVQERRRNGRNGQVTIMVNVDPGELLDFLAVHDIVIPAWDENDRKLLSTALEQLINQRWRYNL